MIKSGLTNDDLIRFYEVTAPARAILDRRPHPPPLPDGRYGEEENNWYENSEESKAWKWEYDLAGRRSLDAYLRLRQRIGKRIGARLIAGMRDLGTPETGSMVINVFPRSEFASWASVKKYWNASQTSPCKSHREEFPAGIAYIYFR